MLNINWKLGKNEILKEMNKISDNKKSLLPEGISGYYAKCAFETITKPKNNPIGNIEGGQVFIKPSTDGTTQVHICRNGMWITRRAPKLGYIKGINPVHVVILAGKGKASRLIRSAEDPLHMKLNRKRLLNKKERKEYDLLIDKIREYIINQAGKLESSNAYISNLAQFNVRQGPEQLDIFLPRGKRGKDAGNKENSLNTKIGSEKGNKANGKNREKIGNNKEDKGINSPKPGKPIQIKSSFIPVKKSGKTTGIEIDIPEQEFIHDSIGIRIYINSGTDQSCDDPINTEWIEINKSNKKHTKYEIIKKSKNFFNSTFTIDFIKPQNNDISFGIDFVKRKKQ